jgi:hypothetical protein
MPPRYRRSLEDSLKDMAGSARAVTTLTLAVPELQELGQEYIGPGAIGTDQLIQDAVTADIIAAGAVSEASLDEALTGTVNDLVDGVARIDSEVYPAIDAAAASPITDSRLSEGSLTKWPFQAGVVPSGALAPGAVGATEIADFAIAVRKLKSDRHHLY